MKDIKGFKGLYAITEDGKIWSYPKIPQSPKGRFLKTHFDHNGYPKVNIKINGVSRNYSIHRLVALTYIPNPKKFVCINHKNGDKKDNRIENLEWCTYRENVWHAINNGLRNDMVGTHNPNYKHGNRCRIK